ncbi:MAG: N-acetyl-alpha-D-glucosaminyl L-malate synthase BshA [Bacteroidia bacterium]|nr:N-acetyl-alpha-D-glucosaminyl L-malate synthase BshA [Bacteroidia bacterium]
MKNIGIVCYPTFGGSGVVATELGIALAEKGYQVHFISYSQPVRLERIMPNIHYHEVNVSDYPLFDYQPYELVLASKLVDVTAHYKLDLLHVHYAIPHASAAFMAQQILATRGIRVPFITTLHGTDITLVGKDPSFEPVITFAMNRSSVVTAVSESLKNDTLKFFKVENEINVIPNFIKLEHYKKHDGECNRASYAPAGEKILIHVSNFRKVKRVEDVLRVFDKVRRKIPARLILVGDGPERAAIERLCRELDTCNDIISTGKVVDPTQLLCISDLFILPSETESFGLAALEAMACGVPVISSNTGGIPEVNIHSRTGFLSEVGNIEEMAENAVRLLSDHVMLEQFRKNCLEQSARFDVSMILPQYEKIYRKVLQQ